MRLNLPVVNKETKFPDGPEAKIISIADTRGIIIDVNDTFVDISGFTRDELIGQPHNIVRHPDMPPQIFEYMWKQLKSGKPFLGMIKNRCKDGSYYWVNAFIIPIINDGKIIAYESVRTRPSPDMVKRASDVYAKIKNKKRISYKRFNLSLFFFCIIYLLSTIVALADPYWYTVGFATIFGALSIFKVSSIHLSFCSMIIKRQNAQIDDITSEIYTGGVSKLNKAKLALIWNEKYVDSMLTRVKEASTRLNFLTENNLKSADENNNEIQRKATETKRAVVRMNEVSDSITGMMDDLLERITKTAGEAESAKKQTDIGKSVSDNTLNIIKSLDEVAHNVSDTIQKLAEQVSKVSEAIDLIDNVSSQTNLLALNASIEAARAGEYGKGFAVVADEVRALSMRTHDSAVGIHEQLTQFKELTASAKDLAENSQTEAVSGFKEIQHNHDILNLVVDAVDGIKSTSDMMMNTIQEKAELAKSVSDEVKNLIHLSDDTVNISSKTRDDMKKIGNEANDLSEMVSRFNKSMIGRV